MTELRLLQCRVDGRYDIEDCLGRGSYAEIYVARDRGAADEQFRKVVIKALNVLLQGYQDLDLERTLVQNFQNEAIALDRVRHPNIISRLGHGTAIDLNGVAFHYIVLEFLGGGDLAALGRREPLRLERAMFYLQQVCAGLAHAHECGVIHRDIKPQNLLLTADQETAKIADFGVAKLEAGDGAITRVGTNIYAAPEHNPLVQTGQLDSSSLSGLHAQLTPAADIYSLAKTAYTLVCGAPPRRFAQHPIADLPSPVADKYWSERVLRVLEQATQTNARARYQTVEEFWDDLSEATLPPTRPLIAGQETRRPTSLDLNLDVAVVNDPPPRPRFETSRDLQREPVAGNGMSRPRIVVPVGDRLPPGIISEPIPTAGRVTVSVPRNESVAYQTIPQPAPLPPRRRGRAFVVGTILVLTFAGLLLATGTYVRSRWNRQLAIQQGVQAINVGQEGVTTTDLNLRAGPSATNDQIGLAENGSRIRVLTAGTNWCEVQVVQHARPKSDPSSADRGWVNKKFLKFD